MNEAEDDKIRNASKAQKEMEIQVHRPLISKPSRIPTRVGTPETSALTSLPTARFIKHAIEAPKIVEVPRQKQEPEVSLIKEPTISLPASQTRKEEVSVSTLALEQFNKPVSPNDLGTIAKGFFEQQQRQDSLNANAKVFVPKRREAAQENAWSEVPTIFVQQPSPRRTSKGYNPRFIDMDQFHSSILGAMPYSAIPNISKRTTSVQMQRLLEQTYSHWKSLVSSDSPCYRWREIVWRDPTDCQRAAQKRQSRILVGTAPEQSLLVALINVLILTTPIEGPITHVARLLNRSGREVREIQSTEVISAAVEDIQARTGNQARDYFQLLMRWQSRVDLDQRLFATPLLESFADTEDYKALKHILGPVPILHGLLISPKEEKDVLQAYTKWFFSLRDVQETLGSSDCTVPDDDGRLLQNWIQEHSAHLTSYGVSQIIGKLGSSKIGLFYCDGMFYTIMTCNGVPNKIRDATFTPRNTETAEHRIAELETKAFYLLTDDATDCTAIDAVWKELRSDDETHYFTGDFQETDPVRKKWTLQSSANSWRGFLGVKNRLKKQVKIESRDFKSGSVSSAERAVPWDSLIERIESNNDRNSSEGTSVANSYTPALSVIAEDPGNTTTQRSQQRTFSNSTSFSNTTAVSNSTSFSNATALSQQYPQLPRSPPRSPGDGSGNIRQGPPPGLTAQPPEKWTRPPVRQPSLPPPVGDLEAQKSRSPDTLSPPENNFSARRRASTEAKSQAERSDLKIFDPQSASYKPVFAAQSSSKDQPNLKEPGMQRGFTFEDFQKFMASQAGLSFTSQPGFNRMSAPGAQYNGHIGSQFVSGPSSTYNSVPPSVYGGGIGSNFTSRPSSPPSQPGNFRGYVQNKEYQAGLAEITNNILAARNQLTSNGRPSAYMTMSEADWEEEMRMREAKLQAERRSFSNQTFTSLNSEAPSLIMSETGPMDSAGIMRILRSRA